MTLTAAALLVLWLAVYGCGPEAPVDPVVDVGALPADQVPQLLVRNCHGSVAGMDRFSALVRLPEGDELSVCGVLPDRLRVQWPDGAIHLLADGHAERRIGADGHAELSAPAATRMRAMLTLLDAAALGPVRRATACTRTGPRTFTLTQPAGPPWQLTLAERALLVDELRSSEFTVHVVDHLRTSQTRIVRAATVDPFGLCQIRFDAVGIPWEDKIFDATRPATRGTQQWPLTIGTPAQPRTPVLEAMRAWRWVVVADPSDWRERTAVVQRYAKDLQAAGQHVAFAGFVAEGERTQLVIPFRPADDAGQRTFQVPADWTVREVPAGRELVVFPGEGDIAQRTALGERMLREELTARGLTAAGPVLAQPFLHLDEGLPDSKALAATAVRVSVAVR